MLSLLPATISKSQSPGELANTCQLLHNMQKTKTGIWDKMDFIFLCVALTLENKINTSRGSFTSRKC